MRRTLCLLVLVATFAAVAEEVQWLLEPTDFRGAPFGTPIAEFRSKVKGVSPCVTDDPCFLGYQRIGDIPTSEVYTFDDGKFVQVYLSFDSERYADLKDIFIEKYGQPAEVQTKMVTTGSGAEFENEKLYWKGPNVMISLSRLGSTTRKGSAVISNREFLERQAAESAAAKKKAAESF